MSEARREDFATWVRLPVRWGDLDSLGHVNNAKFFTYNESSRLDYFDSLMAGDPRMWVDYGLILASTGADFHRQLRYPATLDLGTRISRLGRSSLNMLTGMFEGETLVATVTAAVVWFDYQAQRSAPLPDRVRRAIVGREAVTPEGA